MGEKDIMCEVLERLIAEGEARAMNKTVEILHLIMSKNSWSKKQTMEFIDIPESEFDKYAALL